MITLKIFAIFGLKNLTKNDKKNRNKNENKLKINAHKDVHQREE